MIVSMRLNFYINGENDFIDVTDKAQSVIEDNNLVDGIATVFDVGSTGAVITIEYEPGLRADLMSILRIILAYQYCD